jgi:hypothetical protein
VFHLPAVHFQLDGINNMTQSAYAGVIPNGSGASVRGNINLVDQAILSQNSGNSAPNPTYPFMKWQDTSNDILYQRNLTNTGWEIIENYGATTNPDEDNDVTEGYIRGSIWINTTLNTIWICSKNTNGAAIWQKIDNQTKTLYDYGAVGGGSADDTTPFQNALSDNVGKVLIVPDDIFRLTSNVHSDDPVMLIGDSVSFTISNTGNPSSTFNGGSRLYFDHSGVGITFGTGTGGGTSYNCGFLIKNIAFIRDQPAPAASWAPNNDDYDVFIDWAGDVDLINLFFLSSTRGIKVIGAGRINIYRLRGHFFINGIYIDESYDIMRIDQVHIWPFWSHSDHVWTYTTLNLDTIITGRNDDCYMSNIFSIFCHSLVRFIQTAAGRTWYLQVTNAVADISLIGFWVDNTNDSKPSMQLTNFFYSGPTLVNFGFGIYIQGDTAEFNVVNFKSLYVYQNVIRIEGSDNIVEVTHLQNDIYDVGSAGWAAFDVANGNTLIFNTVPRLIGTTGAGPKYSSTGTIKVDEWRDYTPTIGAATGSITSYTSSGKYKYVNNTVEVKFNFTITNNGTGANSNTISLPFTAGYAACGSCREMAVVGYMGSVVANASSVAASVQKYDNTYLGGTNHRIIGELNYIV